MSKVINFEEERVIYPTEENAAYTIIVNPEKTARVNVINSMDAEYPWTIVIYAPTFDSLPALRNQGLALLKQQMPLR